MGHNKSLKIYNYEQIKKCTTILLKLQAMSRKDHVILFGINSQLVN